jgi:hypothetical protein
MVYLLRKRASRCSAARGFGVNHGGINSFRVLDNLSGNRLFFGSVLVAVTHEPHEHVLTDESKRAQREVVGCGGSTHVLLSAARRRLQCLWD